MGFKTIIFIVLLLILRAQLFSQDYFGYGSSNFGGLNQVIANPAAAADNRLMVDVTLLGADATINNSWFKIKRQALKNHGTLANPKFDGSWSNVTPNVDNNMFKNFVVLHPKKNRAAIIENRILLPSFMVQLDRKSAVAFTWSLRQFANIDGITPQLAYLFENELGLNVTQNNAFQTKNFSGVQMSWAEYGLTYARVLKDKNEHFIKAGITPKLLQGFESAFFVMRDFNFLLSTKDTLSYLNADFSYAHSALPGSGGFYRFTSRPGFGLDLGVIYEWRPDHEKYRLYDKERSWKRNRNKYKLKLGASLNDLGRIKFKKDGTFYDLNVAVRQSDVTRLTQVKDYNELDSILKADYSNPGQKKTSYTIVLPTALNLQADYALSRFFYLNLSAHLTNFYKTAYKVHNYSALCFAPRVEHYWFDVSLPLTLNALSARRSEYLMAGLNVRLGPLCIGSNNLVPLFKNDPAGVNLYAILKVAIPYRDIRDTDRDGVPDKKDLCPKDSGDIALNGCPDKDHDNIADKDDACPHQPGLAKFRGCPDSDDDGIKDGDDACPHDKGLPWLKGCPDADKDSIADKDDACPGVAGTKQFKGCPDTDQDGVPDKDDLCPDKKGLLKYQGCPDTDNDNLHDGIDSCAMLAGPAENKGCPWPDTDKDGIIDRLDSCITVAGIPAYKGCPEPVKIAAVEKRIIEKAFSHLEFETGKDIIKKTSYASLNALATLLKVHTDAWTIRLSGHTDNKGTEESNMVLSENRANAVKNYLLKKGVPGENIITEWFGQGRPIADNDTPAGRKKNRRVEMTVLAKED